MQCANCGFSVPKALKFSIMKNLCPACGTALFTEKDISQIKAYNNKIKSQSFAKDLNDVSAYDCALFLFNEVQLALSNFNKEDIISEPIEIAEEINEENLKEVAEKEFEFDKEALKNEVLKEMSFKNKTYTEVDDSEYYEDDEPVDLSDRVSRLKRSYQKSKPLIDKTRGSFRRVGEE